MLYLGIALMVLLFIYVGKLNRALLAEIETKKKARSVARSALL